MYRRMLAFNVIKLRPGTLKGTFIGLFVIAARNVPCFVSSLTSSGDCRYAGKFLISFSTLNAGVRPVENLAGKFYSCHPHHSLS
jgi:hypothetical protein